MLALRSFNILLFSLLYSDKWLNCRKFQENTINSIFSILEKTLLSEFIEIGTKVVSSTLKKFFQRYFLFKNVFLNNFSLIFFKISLKICIRFLKGFINDNSELFGLST